MCDDPNVPSLVNYLEKRLEIVDEKEQKAAIEQLHGYVEYWVNHLSHIHKYNVYDDKDKTAPFLLGNFEHYPSEFNAFPVMNSMRNVDPTCEIERFEVNCDVTNAADSSGSTFSINLQHSIRRSQMMHLFGIGAMVNFTMNECLMPQGLDAWDELFKAEDTDRSEFVVKDDRLANRLGVSGFLSPPIFRDNFNAGVSSSNKNYKLKIKGSVFPSWHVCTRCNALTNRLREKNHLQPMVCKSRKKPSPNRPSCYEFFTNKDEQYKAGELSPFRVVAACKVGHIQDLPLEEIILRSKVFHELYKATFGGSKDGYTKFVKVCLEVNERCKEFTLFALRFYSSTKKAGISNIYLELDFNEFIEGIQNFATNKTDRARSDLDKFKKIVEGLANKNLALQSRYFSTTNKSKRNSLRIPLSLLMNLDQLENIDCEGVRCSGSKPWLVQEDTGKRNFFQFVKDSNCTEKLKALPRGSASVYYPITRSSIQVPIADAAGYYEKLSKHPNWNHFIDEILEDCGDEYLHSEPGMLKVVDDLLDKIRGFKDSKFGFSTLLARYEQRDSSDQGLEGFKLSFDSARKDLKCKILSEINLKSRQRGMPLQLKEVPSTGVKELASDDSLSEEILYRLAEYNLFRYPSQDNNDAVVYSNDIPSEYPSTFGIHAMALVHQVKETVAFCGFTRVDPPSINTSLSSLRQQLSIEGDIDWLPAVENKGEGICIFFDTKHLEDWSLGKKPMMRADHLWARLTNDERDWNNLLEESAAYLFLHTFAHLLINEFSYSCGYSAASLKERIYCNLKGEESQKMAAVFIYTASADSEGSLGGLVRLGSDPKSFLDLVSRAVTSAEWCSNDPVCIQTDLSKMVNVISACHNCAYIPETACENSNSFLDRAMVVGTLENPQLGFIPYLKSTNSPN